MTDEKDVATCDTTTTDIKKGDVAPMSKWEKLAYGGGEIYGSGYAALLGVVL